MNLTVEPVFEFAAVRAVHWDDQALDLVPFASLREAEEEIRDLSCFSHGSAKRNRAFFTEIARRRAPVCRSGTDDDFVIVKVLSFR